MLSLERKVSTQLGGDNPIDENSPREDPNDFAFLPQQAKRGAKIELRALFEAWVTVFESDYKEIDIASYSLPKDLTKYNLTSLRHKDYVYVEKQKKKKQLRTALLA